MISERDFLQATQTAYKELERFSREESIEPRDFVLRFRRRLGAALAQRFAERTTKIKVYPFDVLSRRFPSDGFASWLMRRPHAAIVLDLQHLRSRTELPVDVQTARTIFHEVGHVLLQPYLLDKPNTGSPYHAQSADPAEENQAWVFAMALMAIILGDYSEDKKSSYNVDDSPTIAV